MCEVHNFSLPTKIIFGCGSLNLLPQEIHTLLKDTKSYTIFSNKITCLLVTGKCSMKKAGVVERISLLLSSSLNIEIVLFDKVEPEVTTDNVEQGVEVAKEAQPDVIVGLGGGSAIDCGKAISGLSGKKNGSVAEYLEGKKEIDTPGIPYIAIPTTAGTGAEVTPNAVLINKEKGTKTSLRSKYLYPQIALIDPELTITLPPKITAYSGMDALSQSIEAYVSLGASVITDAIAVKSVELIMKNILTAYRNGENVSSREGMSYGALLSGIALSNARLGLVHAIAHPLGAVHNIPHGLLCGLLLPYVMEYNKELPQVAQKYSELAKILPPDEKNNYGSGADCIIDKIKSLLKELNFPENLRSLGVKKDDFKKIASAALSSSGSIKFNPRKANEKDIEEILNIAW
jgi:alcohol dehydrogenase